MLTDKKRDKIIRSIIQDIVLTMNKSVNDYCSGEDNNSKHDISEASVLFLTHCFIEGMAKQIANNHRDKEKAKEYVEEIYRLLRKYKRQTLKQIDNLKFKLDA